VNNESRGLPISFYREIAIAFGTKCGTLAVSLRAEVRRCVNGRCIDLFPVVVRKARDALYILKQKINKKEKEETDKNRAVRSLRTFPESFPVDIGDMFPFISPDFRSVLFPRAVPTCFQIVFAFEKYRSKNNWIVPA